MHYLLSRSSPEASGVNPEGFFDARFVNELETSGFFEETKNLTAENAKHLSMI